VKPRNNRDIGGTLRGFNLPKQVRSALRNYEPRAPRVVLLRIESKLSAWPLATLLGQRLRAGRHNNRFLAQDMSLRGADQRQRTIECIADEPFQLLDALDWVAYPETAATDVRLLWTACEHQKFRSRSYVVDVNENPASLVSVIRDMARKDLEYIWEPPDAS
jgi:hypothetical protein